MKSKRKEINILIYLIIALLAINYPFLDDHLRGFFTETETIHVDRIIDGDTIESNGTSIRFLGINTPERGEFYYEEAKDFLRSRILNQTVLLKFGKDRYDKYDRTLAYVFLNDTNINLELVEKGYANYYFYGGKDQYSNALEDAWNECIQKNENLCEKSEDVCAECIELEDSRTLKNICGFDCDINSWRIETEGRNYTELSNTLKNQEEASFNLELMPTGDTIFLRDDEGKLVFWKKY